MLLENYDRTLNEWSELEKAAADDARLKGDEREHALHLMRAGMLGKMLHSLGRIQHSGANPGIMAQTIADLRADAEKQRTRGDYDEAQRAEIKSDMVQKALDLLIKLEERS